MGCFLASECDCETAWFGQMSALKRASLFGSGAELLVCPNKSEKMSAEAVAAMAAFAAEVADFLGLYILERKTNIF